MENTENEVPHGDTSKENEPNPDLSGNSDCKITADIKQEISTDQDNCAVKVNGTVEAINDTVGEKGSTVQEINDMVVENDTTNQAITDQNEKKYSIQSTSKEPAETKLGSEVDSPLAEGTDDGRRKLRKPSNKKVMLNFKFDERPVKKKSKKPRVVKKPSNDCDICYKSFASKVRLDIHKRKHQKVIKKFTCAICKTVLESNTSLINHKVVHKDEGRTFVCEECESAFTEHKEFLRHELTHISTQVVKCSECEAYLKKRSMPRHIETHFDQRIECEICNKFFDPSKIKNHIASHIPKVYRCIECDLECNSQSQLNAHMIKHTGFKPYQCYYCGLGLSTKQSRKNHMMVHTQEKRFECKICFNKYTQSSTLKKHLVTHQTEKRFQCDVCKKKFFHKSSVRDHWTIHFNTQRYKCNLCKKALSTYVGLKSHMLYKHSNERRFKCELCNSTFKKQIILNHHYKTIRHRRKMYGAQLKKENTSE